MKARLNGTNDAFAEITQISLANNQNVIYNADVIEFEQEKTLQEPTSDHWQDVMERAAIAAMQGTITILSNSDRTVFTDIIVEGFKGTEKTYPNEIAQFAVACADALIKELNK